MRIQNHGHVWAVDRDGTGESCSVDYLLESKTRGDKAARAAQPLARPAVAARLCHLQLLRSGRHRCLRVPHFATCRFVVAGPVLDTL